jgi:N-acyl-D-aspartate/D-glutamate deacylase
MHLLQVGAQPQPRSLRRGRKMTLAALSSAIDVALRPLGVRVNVLPATPERVLNWIEEAKTSGG